MVYIAKMKTIILITFSLLSLNSFATKKETCDFALSVMTEAYNNEVRSNPKMSFKEFTETLTASKIKSKMKFKENGDALVAGVWKVVKNSQTLAGMALIDKGYSSNEEALSFLDRHVAKSLDKVYLDCF